ncbi:hypothetical protein EDE11_107103 [Methylomonas methanica]|uniref:Uncharacterized protein n=1 Tax=Methylomonas methanica TaxID=421 RepID=A0ABY2CMW2_METMH|nr:hypothetical protein EDE11_107103 [Methylomonas methanica]
MKPPQGPGDKDFQGCITVCVYYFEAALQQPHNIRAKLLAIQQAETHSSPSFLTICGLKQR